MLEESVEPQVEVDTTQHTPNPAAQVPLAEPPLLSPHSEEVKQVPVVVEELLLVQASLGNWTTLNSDNCSKGKYNVNQLEIRGVGVESHE